VYQGEREIAEENKLLGKFTLTGIRTAPKGVPRIEVLFSIDINGILTVTAVDLSTKSKKQVIVSNSGLLCEAEIREIKKNAEKYRESDLKKKELIDLKNDIYNYVYSIKKIIENPQIKADLVSEAQHLLREAHEILEKEEKEEMDGIRGELSDLNIKLAKMVSQPVEPSKSTKKQARESGNSQPGAPKNEELFFGVKKKPVKDGDKEMLEIKQKILNSIYNIEQYLNNLKLDDRLVAECNILIKRANKELDMGKRWELEKTYKDLTALEKKVDGVVSASLGFADEPADEDDINKADTKPFKLYTG
ncbi:MAG TPA: Hsp70 family protein, partial [Candidatus Kapabacteria bacterium]|nr:Hsp70 family protein [Candidatus Kapabacteria bacterium]